MKQIKVKRIYEEASEDDGYRILVDRLWPRGISKSQAKLNEWKKNIAPSTALRNWFSHKPERFHEFVRLYKIELKGFETDLKDLVSLARDQNICLLFSAKDTQRNQAVVLRDVLQNML